MSFAVCSSKSLDPSTTDALGLILWNTQSLLPVNFFYVLVLVLVLCKNLNLNTTQGPGNEVYLTILLPHVSNGWEWVNYFKEQFENFKKEKKQTNGK